VVTLVYIGLLLVAQSAVGLDTDDRFMRPVAPGLVLLAAVLLARSRPPRRRWLPATAGLLAGGVLAVHALPAAATRTGAGAEPGDYNSATWRHSALIGALRAHRPQRILVSNDAYAVSLLADLPVESSPTTVFDNSDTPTGESAQFESDVTDQPRLLAWFDHSEVADLVSLRELARIVCLQPIARYPDGLLLATCGPVPRP
jgi:hypothetical protein